MVAITALKANDVVFEVVMQKMGNTHLRRQAVYRVRIVEVDLERNTVLASWNGNAPEKFSERAVGKWRRTTPASKALT
jgi:hypothetical protein